MYASPSIIEYIEQALRALMVVLTGGTMAGEPTVITETPIEAESFLLALPEESALLFAQSDGPVAPEDVTTLQLRLLELQYRVAVVENKKNHVVFQVTGPSLEPSRLAQLFARGEFAIGTLEASEEWMGAFSDTQLEGAEAQKTTFPPVEMETLVAQNQQALEALMPTLRKQNRDPFVYCPRDDYPAYGCALYAMKPDMRIVNGDILRTEIVWQEYFYSYSYTLTLSEDAAARFAQLTAANLHRQLPIVIDGEALSMPTVQSEITGGSLQITGLNIFGSGSAGDEPINAHIFFTKILHPPLKQHWKLVHKQPIQTPVPEPGGTEEARRN